MADQLPHRGQPERARQIAQAMRNLHTEKRRWDLQPGQLLIVDEASLAGTFTLDTLVAQAARADAKVLVVGDHAQLSAVDAGGAFHLLAEHGSPTTLTSLWRFTNRWEAQTTRLLRTGNPQALDAYAEHDRITTGPGEAMLEAAYTAWQESEAGGHSAILLAADTHAVDALNLRAHTDRVTDGLVSPTGITTPHGTTLATGDRIVTRRNARHLRLPSGGYVRNGDLWDVALTHPDGSLTVTKTTRTSSPGRSTADVNTSQVDAVHLNAAYVAEHIDLGYATTTHRAQGVTVDHAHVLAAPGMTRESLYVAMTRGRSINHVYTSTDVVDPMCDYLPDPHGASAGRDVLERILATTGAELSATQTITHNLDHATSPERLDPIRQTLATDAATRHWLRVLPECGLNATQTETIGNSPARGPLVAALRQGADAGHPMRTVLRTLVESRQLDDPTSPAHDIAAVLHDRLTTWLDAQFEGRIPDLDATSGTEAIDPSDSTAEAIGQIDALSTGRITNPANGDRPDWMRPLGDTPDLNAAHDAWSDQIAALITESDLNLVAAGGQLSVSTSRTKFNDVPPCDPPPDWSVTR